MLTVEDVGRRAGWCDRTARTYVAAWFHAWTVHRQHVALGETSRRPRVPEVRREPTGGRGRPPYRVDPASFDAWLRNGVAPANQAA